MEGGSEFVSVPATGGGWGWMLLGDGGSSALGATERHGVAALGGELGLPLRVMERLRLFSLTVQRERDHRLRGSSGGQGHCGISVNSTQGGHRGRGFVGVSARGQGN